MKNLQSLLTNKFWIFYVLAFVLFFPAMLINLGIYPFTTDEPIRINVAMEMLFRDNFITPTMAGELYFKKPPLYNWMLIANYQIFESWNEYHMRLTTIFMLIIYTSSIFAFTRKYYDNKTAFLNALMFLTSGRILFWDSMLALIDISFSWIMYSNFMIIYHYFNKKQYLKLFFLSYLLTAVGFLFKGIPSVVFQGFTILALFIFHREFKQLFSWKHIIGGLSFFIWIGFYYFAYFNDNQDLGFTVFETLWTESTQRTVVNYGWGRTIMHLFTFPLEMLYHFAPWSFMLLLLLNKSSWRIIRKDDFLFYNFIVFTANIWVYWTSPEVYPRYLHMFTPLIFIIFIRIYQHLSDKNALSKRIFDYTLVGIVSIGAIGSLAIPFIPLKAEINLLWPKAIFLSACLIVLAYAILKTPKLRLHLFILTLLVIRIGFNWIVLEERVVNSKAVRQYNSVKTATKETLNNNLYIWKQSPVDDESLLFISRERNQLLTRAYEIKEPDACYIVTAKGYDPEQMEMVSSFNLLWENRLMYIVRFKNP